MDLELIQAIVIAYSSLYPFLHCFIKQQFVSDLKFVKLLDSGKGGLRPKD